MTQRPSNVVGRSSWRTREGVAEAGFFLVLLPRSFVRLVLRFFFCVDRFVYSAS